MRLFEETRMPTSLNHTSTYAWYIGTLVVDIKVFKTCRPHRYVAALRGTDNGSCHFHSTLLAALSDVGVCLFLALYVVYLLIYAKLGLVIDMTKQISDGKEADMVNWQSSKIMSTERSEVDMTFLVLTIH